MARVSEQKKTIMPLVLAEKSHAQVHVPHRQVDAVEYQMA